MSILVKKQRWDRQPTAPAAVLLASDGRQGFGTRAVARAAALAGSEPVAVVTIARIYGSSYGLPAPGLMPSKDEMNERLAWIREAIARLKREGVEADGQVAQTRRAARTLARVARARGVRVVVIESREKSKGRRLIEGDVASEVARALRRSDVEVDVIPGAVHTAKASSDSTRERTRRRRRAAAKSN